MVSIIECLIIAGVFIRLMLDISKLFKKYEKDI